MATINTTEDLLRAARENREFREAFRRELLDNYTDENIGALTKNVAELTEQVTKFMKAHTNWSNRVDNDMAVLKGIGLESKLYNRGIALMATHLRMHEGRIVRVAEVDDNSREFNSAILSACRDGQITQVQYDRILDTDMVVAGTEVESGNPIYAVIEASYSLAGDDISKVCATAALVGRLFPGAVVKPVLYYVTPNARLEGEATDQDVTLVRTPGIR